MSDDASAPSWLRLAGEAGAIGEWLGAALRPTPRSERGRGRTVMTIPGFLADDLLTAPLRNALARSGYRSLGWGSGRNLGVKKDLIEDIERRVAAAGGGGKVALVGWSLGGLYAREIGKRSPDLVERVVTLGTPFSGDLRTNNNARWLYERVAGHKVDKPPVTPRPEPKPGVPTIALWSRRDGIVAPAAARGLPTESDAQVEVDCLHLGFVADRRAVAAVLDALDMAITPTPASP